MNLNQRRGREDMELPIEEDIQRSIEQRMSNSKCNFFVFQFAGNDSSQW